MADPARHDALGRVRRGWTGLTLAQQFMLAGAALLRESRSRLKRTFDAGRVPSGVFAEFFVHAGEQ